jgi:hypothetical protein
MSAVLRRDLRGSQHRDLAAANLPATRAAIAEFWAIERPVVGSRQEVLPW